MKKGFMQDMSFLDHLEELRWHIVRAVVGILILSIAAFCFKSLVFDTIVFGPKHIDFITYRGLCYLGKLLNSEATLCLAEIPIKITNIDMAGQFVMHMKISFIMGLVFGFPYVFWEIWRFIVPALKPTESRYTGVILFFVIFLFYLGVSFGYFILTPFSINFLATYSISEDIENAITLNSYISTITMMVLASGVVFEMPILIYFLAKTGVVSPKMMSTYRRHAIIVILFIAAIITPPDVVSQVITAIPIYILYEIGIFIAKRVYKEP
jgi:sec-independent protein translocase protein TatC